MKKWLLIFVAAIILTIGYFYVTMGHVEKPKYKVVSKETDNIEIRRYEPVIIAKVTVEGEREEALNKGFRTLADFIFGNNMAEEEISMTAPVELEPKSEKIAMTAPVTLEGDEGSLWTVTFTMPAEYTMETLPKPVNEKVEIVEIPAKEYIVLRFRGRSTAENFAKHKAVLDKYIVEHDMRVIGNVKLAYYNPPWTPFFLRRNEVMYELSGRGQ